MHCLSWSRCRRFAVAAMLSLTATPALAQFAVPEPAAEATGRNYSWLRFSDDFTAEEPADRVARQPEPAAVQPPADDMPSAVPAQPQPVAAPTATTHARPVPACDAKKRQALQKAVGDAHKMLFYNNDFGYVLDPCYNDWWPGDHFKRQALGDCLMIDVGGQYRVRFHSERNFRGLGLTGRDDDFLLHRTRLYTNVEVGENLRFFGEMVDGVSEFENFAPRSIEENRTDVLNFFIDGTLWEADGGTLRGRVGRQELLYGAQRLISPLDWSNIRRTFDGAKLMWQSENWDVDGFWVRPLVHDTHALDNSNLDEQFYGAYSTYKGFENELLDVYWLGYENTLEPFRYHTVGSRYNGTYDNWLTELEAGYQFGDNTDGSDHHAGFFTAGLGRKWNSAWSPTLWIYYDWASGDSELAAHNGFHHLFPLGHYFLGFMDLFGRQNIETPNVQLTLQPTERLRLMMWYYYFFLENKNDGPYSLVMTPFANVTPGSADLGHELDFTASYTINARTNLLLGYSHFFSGAYYDTPGLPYSGDADFYYSQITIGF
jgi:hypothetical protein